MPTDDSNSQASVQGNGETNVGGDVVGRDKSSVGSVTGTSIHIDSQPGGPSGGGAVASLIVLGVIAVSAFVVLGLVANSLGVGRPAAAPTSPPREDTLEPTVRPPDTATLEPTAVPSSTVEPSATLVPSPTALPTATDTPTPLPSPTELPSPTVTSSPAPVPTAPADYVVLRPEPCTEDYQLCGSLSAVHRYVHFAPAGTIRYEKVGFDDGLGAVTLVCADSLTDITGAFRLYAYEGVFPRYTSESIEVGPSCRIDFLLVDKFGGTAMSLIYSHSP